MIFIKNQEPESPFIAWRMEPPFLAWSRSRLRDLGRPEPSRFKKWLLRNTAANPYMIGISIFIFREFPPTF